MFSLEMCHLLNYSLCFYSAIEPTFVLELRVSYTVFALFTPGAPGVRFYTPESPGANVVNGGGFPETQYDPSLLCKGIATTLGDI